MMVNRSDRTTSTTSSATASEVIHSRVSFQNFFLRAARFSSGVCSGAADSVSGAAFFAPSEAFCSGSAFFAPSEAFCSGSAF